MSLFRAFDFELNFDHVRDKRRLICGYQLKALNQSSHLHHENRKDLFCSLRKSRKSAFFDTILLYFRISACLLWEKNHLFGGVLGGKLKLVRYGVSDPYIETESYLDMPEHILRVWVKMIFDNFFGRSGTRSLRLVRNIPPTER